MKINQGMNLDARPEEQPAGTSRFTKNFIREKGSKQLINEGGTVNLSTFGANRVVIGEVLLSNNDKVLFLTDNTTSEIALVTSRGDRTILVSDTTILNFTKDHLIDAEFVVNTKGEYIVIWTDNNNVMRSYNVTANPGITSESDIAVYPTATDTPVVEVAEVLNSSGRLETGSYLFTVALRSKDGAQMNYADFSQPVYINDELFTGNLIFYDGCDGGLSTSKAIRLNITNIDTNFDEVRIAAVVNQNGVLVRVNYVDIPISGTSLTYLFSGQETDTLALDDVLIDKVVYRRAKALTQIDGQVYAANLGVKYINLQSMALDITTKFVKNVTVDEGAATETQHKAPFQSTHQLRSFQRDEVFSFYVSGVTKYGEETQKFHIPGRARNVFWTNGVNTVYEDDDVQDLITFATPYATEAASVVANDPTAKVFQYFNLRDATYNSAFWQNENETYPNTSDWGSLAGLPVRLHRTPDLEEWPMTTAPSDDAEPIGVQFGNITIPAEYADEIVELRFYMVKRYKGQSRVLDITNLCNATEQQAAGALNVNLGWRNLGGGGSDPNHADTAFCQPIDIKLNPSILSSASYIKTFHYYEDGSNLNKTGPYTPTAVGTHYETFVNTSARSSLMAAADRIRFIQDAVNLAYEQPAQLTTSGWPADWHTYRAGPIRTGGRDFIGLLLDADLWASASNILRAIDAVIYTGLTDLYSLRPTEFNLIGSVDVDDIGSMPEWYTGDSFVQAVTMLYVGTYVRESISTPGTYIESCQAQALRNWYETQTQTGMRESGEDKSQGYVPKYAAADYFNDATSAGLDIIDNYLVVNPQFMQLSSIKTGVPFFTTEVSSIEENLTTRVIRSQKYNGIGSSYKTFLPNDYLDLQRNRGEIWALSNFNNILIPHLERAIVRTKGREELSIGISTAYLGSGDIFAVKPDEIILTDEGYAGTQSQFASITSHFGYLFVDRHSRKVFLFNGQLQEISNNGLNEFFEANLGSALEQYGYYLEDNPYGLDGVIAGFDLEQDRFLITKKGVKPTTTFTNLFIPPGGGLPSDYIAYDPSDNRFHRITTSPPTDTVLEFDDPTYFQDDSWTLSFYPDTGVWISFHDYIPDFYVKNRQKIYTAKANKLYRHNNRSNPGSFYGAPVQPAIVTPCFSSNNSQSFYTSGFDIKASLRNLAGGKLLTETFTKAIVSNSYQCSGEVALEHLDTVRVLRDVTMFNSFRDIAVDTSKAFFTEDFELDATTVSAAKPWYQKSRFIDTHIQLRLEYDNVDAYELTVYDVQPNVKQSYR